MRVLLIVNATASTVTVRKRVVIQKALRADHDLEIAATSERGHAAELAREAAADGVDVVAVLAGDGTLNEAANGLAGSHTALAPLPGGSTNVYARTIGVSRDVVEATGQLLDSLERRSFERIGLGLADDRYFLFHMGAGFDAAVVREVEQRAPWKRYAAHPLFFLSALGTWLRYYDHSRPRFRIELPAGEVVEGCIFAIVSKTSPYSFLGSRPLVVSPDTGLHTELGLTAFRARHTPTFAAVSVSAMASGRMIRRHPSMVHRTNLRALTIVGDGRFPWQVDGEYLGEAERLSVRYEPDALTLVVPDVDPAP